MQRLPHTARCLVLLLGSGLLLIALRVGFAAETAGAPSGAAPAQPANPYAALLAQEAQSLQAVCGSKCHALALFIDAPRAYDVWHDTVQKMLDRGAVASDDQLQDIMDYLHQTLTTIDVNAAAAEELEIVLNLSPSQSQAVIARRASRKFSNLDDLKSVAGLDAKALDEKVRLILYQ
jgi:hypothetical protein